MTSLDAKDLIGMPVVTVADGTKLGNVRDLLFDASELSLAALIVASNAGRSILFYPDLRSIGGDVITIEDATKSQSLEGNAAVQQCRNWHDISSLRVISAEGEWLGDVGRVELDRPSGKIAQITVHKGGVLGLGGTTVTFTASAIRGIGPKVLTVEFPAGKEQDQQAGDSAS